VDPLPVVGAGAVVGDGGAVLDRAPVKILCKAGSPC
jgi:hypothetical protein